MGESNRYLVLFALVALVIVALACDVSVNVTTGGQMVTAFAPTLEIVPTATPFQDGEAPETDTPTPTGEPTDTPTLTDEPTEESDGLAVLKEEVYFVMGGMGADPLCLPAPKVSPPAIVGEVGAEVHALCLFGVPRNEKIEVRLYAPGGAHVGSGSFLIKGGTHSLTVKTFPPTAVRAVTLWDADSRLVVLEIYPWWPVGLPRGEWYATAKSPTLRAQGLFAVKPYAGHAISTMPDTAINPLESHRCDSYSAGEEVVIRGAGLKPNEDTPLGVYYYTKEVRDGERVGSLVRGIMVRTDSRGSFRTSIRVEPHDRAGTYYVIATTYWGDKVSYPPAGYHQDACYRVP